ncbi:MAG: LytTR family transcriptional regulator [Clostridia bacterium]|nr:LytTR family transcriptional regulator [Clostridia bacterium]
MKLQIVIEKNRDEEILIYAHEKTPLICEIEELVNNNFIDLKGYTENETVKLNLNDVYCFVTEDNKVYALTEKGKYRLKLRLYQLEENLNNNFVKINQSCIANIKKIDRFKATVGGSLTVIFKNGYVDFVSRRNLKKVKERLGL